jgi:pyruvate formate lyase activating enzyme
LPEWDGPWVPAGFVDEVQGGSRCWLCPHGCLLADGEAGPCNLRRRFDGRLMTGAFSTVARHWTAVERKPLYHFRPGLRCLTLAPPGCTMGCLYCQNFKASQVGRSDQAVRAAAAVSAQEIMLEATAAAGAVALSYTEPTLGAELTMALSDAGDAPLIWKTNGFLTPEAAAVIAPRLSAANIDLKSADETAHSRLTGAALGPVLETLAIFRAAGVWVEISTPLIEGFNDDPDSVERIARTVAGFGDTLPWHLLRVTPEYRLTRINPTSPLSLNRAVEIGRRAGLKFVYVERALGEAGRATRCPGCDATAVTRDIWQAGQVLLDDGACRGCGEQIPGVWKQAQAA